MPMSASVRWSFYGNADVSVGLSLAMTLGFLLLCVLCVRWIFKTGYRLRS
jgi:ABC-2 type transport system permease protein